MAAFLSPMGNVAQKNTLHVRVSDHVEMYVNHIDFRKIMYRFMSQYALERTEKICSIC